MSAPVSMKYGRVRNYYGGEFVESKAAAEAMLDQLRHEDGFAGIAEAKDDRAPKISVAEQICRDRGANRADSDRPSRASTQCYDGTGGYAGGGPEHRDPIGYDKQGKAQPRRPEIRDANDDGEPKRADPPPCSIGTPHKTRSPSDVQ